MSHTVMSWIQFYGLIISLLGFFYVSMGLFEVPQTNASAHGTLPNNTPAKAVVVLRPLLPASASFLQITSWINFFPGNMNIWSRVTVIGTAGFFAIFTYILIYFKQNQTKQDFYNFMIYNPPLRLLARILLLLAGPLWGIKDYNLTHNLSRSLLWASCVTLLIISIYAERYLIIFLSEDKLKIIGVVLSVLGLLTSFLPAVLNVLNISLT